MDITPRTEDKKLEPKPTFNTFPETAEPEPEPKAPVEAVQPAEVRSQVVEAPVHDEPVYAGPHLSSQPDVGGRTGTYLPEYAALLVLLSVIIGSITALIGVGIAEMIPDTKTAQESIYATGIDSFQLVFSLSALLASLPFFAWLYFRTRKVEAQTPEVKSHRWRKVFLGAFLAVQGLTVVSLLGGMLFDLLGRWIEVEDSVFSAFSGGSSAPWYQSVIIAILSILVVSVAVFVFSKDYPTEEV